MPIQLKLLPGTVFVTTASQPASVSIGNIANVATSKSNKPPAGHGHLLTNRWKAVRWHCVRRMSCPSIPLWTDRVETVSKYAWIAGLPEKIELLRTAPFALLMMAWDSIHLKANLRFFDASPQDVQPGEGAHSKVQHPVAKKLVKMIVKLLDDKLHSCYTNAQSGIRPVAFNVFSLVMLDLPNITVIGETLELSIAAFLESEAATDRFGEQCLATSIFISPIVSNASFV